LAVEVEAGVVVEVALKEGQDGGGGCGPSERGKRTA